MSRKTAKKKCKAKSVCFTFYTNRDRDNNYKIPWLSRLLTKDEL